MAKSELKIQGTITEALGSSLFKVKLDNDMDIKAKLSGKMRMNYIRVLVGDKVEVEMSPYDLTNGRISKRL